MLEREDWFAWFPVAAADRFGRKRVAWLQTVTRERPAFFVLGQPGASGAGPWRYYVTT